MVSMVDRQLSSVLWLEAVVNIYIIVFPGSDAVYLSTAITFCNQHFLYNIKLKQKHDVLPPYNTGIITQEAVWGSVLDNFDPPGSCRDHHSFDVAWWRESSRRLNLSVHRCWVLEPEGTVWPLETDSEKPRRQHGWWPVSGSETLHHLYNWIQSIYWVVCQMFLSLWVLITHSLPYCSLCPSSR